MRRKLPYLGKPKVYVNKQGDLAIIRRVILKHSKSMYVWLFDKKQKINDTTILTVVSPAKMQYKSIGAL